MTEHGQRLFIARDELVKAHLGPDPDAPAQRRLVPGEVRLAVESFSLTANNITYAAFGEAMKYWQFFPAGDAALGCLPVWGFATVAESQVEGVVPGRRVWGYYPAGTHLVVAPSKVSTRGLRGRLGAPAGTGRASTTSTSSATSTPAGGLSSKGCRPCCGRCS